MRTLKNKKERHIVRPLKPGKQRKFTKNLIGFDIETCNKGKKFVCGSFSFPDGTYKTFRDVKSITREIRFNPFFRNSFICCTNTGYDFFGTFFNQPEIKEFIPIFRQSQLIFARTYIWHNQLFTRMKQSGSHKACSCVFIDTMNYCQLSVKKLGQIIGIPKLESQYMGKMPQNDAEWFDLEAYNKNDALISRTFIEFMFKALTDLGADIRLTIASTSLSLFRNKYLTQAYYSHHPYVLRELQKGYYGGRTEAFIRGYVEDMYYYDFNSMYPSVMLNKFPDPNTLRFCYNRPDIINKYEGLSIVTIKIPKMKYPPLPYRSESKTIFPYGILTGSWYHNELRHAISQGCEIVKVYKTWYFLKTCEPFKKFVTDMYKLRMKYKQEKSPLEMVIKLIMNSAYGKFGQGFENVDNWVHKDRITQDDIDECNGDFEAVGDFVRLKIKEIVPHVYCIPEWAGYVTAYGRIELHKRMLELNPVYVDTDSLLTKTQIDSNLELGGLKLEMTVSAAIIVMPKNYAYKGSKNAFKMKGLPRAYVMGIMKDEIELMIFVVRNPHFEYEKILKFKEAMRRGLVPCEVITVTKEYNLNDTKRAWKKHNLVDLVTHHEFIDSEPLKVEVSI